MNRSLMWMTGVTLALIGGVGGVLAYLKANQRLGEPGVKVVPMEVRGDAGQIIGTNGVALPVDLEGYQSHALPIGQTVLDWLPADTVYGSRQYRSAEGFQAVMNVVLMGSDRTSIHKPEYCLTGVGWAIDSEQSGLTSIPIPGAPGYELPVMRMFATGTFELPGQPARTLRAIYVFWFVADGQLTAIHNERMWWMARDLVTRGLLQRWAYVSCFTYCLPGQEEEIYPHVARLIAATVPHFQLTTGDPAAVAGLSERAAGVGR